MEINKVFVYGTLMTDMENHHIVRPYIKHLEKAITFGLLYDLTYGYPAMVDGQEEILGEIIELKEVNQALEVLDCLEEYFGEGSPKNLYYRAVREIKTMSGKIEKAYIYLWANPETINRIGIPVNHSWRKFRL